jgi:hypothetical protein
MYGHSIMQSDLDELLSMLAEAKERIDAGMASDIAKSKFRWSTLRKRSSISRLGLRTMARRIPSLLYELMVAEMDVAVARFNVTLSTGLLRG